MDDTAHRDDGYRAVGRFIVEFSRLVAEMRHQMVRRLSQPGDPEHLADLPFTGAPAQSIADAFFAMCQLLTDHDGADVKTATRLRNAVGKQVKFRNAVAHGDWYVGSASRFTGEEWVPVRLPPLATRIEAARRDKARKPDPLKALVEDLDAHSDEVARLTEMVRAYGAVCFGEHERQLAGETIAISDVLRLGKKDGLVLVT